MPPIIKQRVVRSYSKKYRLNTLVETGTYLGDMVEATKHIFTRVITVELDEDLHTRALARFRSDANVELIRGDSETILNQIVPTLDEPCLFWLDAHYSGGITARSETDTPIMGELSAVLNRRKLGDVILIDDARLFTGATDYPSLGELRAVIEGTHLHHMEVKHDIIRMHG